MNNLFVQSSCLLTRSSFDSQRCSFIASQFSSIRSQLNSVPKNIIYFRWKEQTSDRQTLGLMFQARCRVHAEGKGSKVEKRKLSSLICCFGTVVASQEAKRKEWALRRSFQELELQDKNQAADVCQGSALLGFSHHLALSSTFFSAIAHYKQKPPYNIWPRKALLLHSVSVYTNSQLFLEAHPFSSTPLP